MNTYQEVLPVKKVNGFTLQIKGNEVWVGGKREAVYQRPPTNRNLIRLTTLLHERSNTMAKATTPSPRKKTVKKAAPRKGAKTAKASTKKAVPKKSGKRSPTKKSAATNGALVVEGRTRVKALAILDYLGSSEATGKELRLKTGFPCMAAVLTKLEAQGFLKIEQHEPKQGQGRTANYYSATAAGKKIVKAATAEELKEAKAGNPKRKELNTWKQLTG